LVGKAFDTRAVVNAELWSSLGCSLLLLMLLALLPASEPWRCFLLWRFGVVADLGLWGAFSACLSEPDPRLLSRDLPPARGVATFEKANAHGAAEARAMPMGALALPLLV
jgi:hypothetical protein